jgi:hypothetical protein
MEQVIERFRDATKESAELPLEFTTRVTKKDSTWPCFTVYVLGTSPVYDRINFSRRLVDFVILDEVMWKGYMKTGLQHLHGITTKTTDSTFIGESYGENGIKYNFFEKGDHKNCYVGKLTGDHCIFEPGMRCQFTFFENKGETSLIRKLEPGVVANLSVTMGGIATYTSDEQTFRIKRIFEIQKTSMKPNIRHVPSTFEKSCNTIESRHKRTYQNYHGCLIWEETVTNFIEMNSNYIINKRECSLNFKLHETFLSNFANQRVQQFMIDAGFVTGVFYQRLDHVACHLFMEWTRFFDKLLESSTALPQPIVDQVKDGMNACVGFKLSERHWVVIDTELKVFTPDEVKEDLWIVDSEHMESGYIMVLFDGYAAVDVVGLPSVKMYKNETSNAAINVMQKLNGLKRKRDFTDC